MIHAGKSLSRRQIVTYLQVLAVAVMLTLFNRDLRALPIGFAMLSLLGVAEVVDLVDRLVAKFSRREGP